MKLPASCIFPWIVGFLILVRDSSAVRRLYGRLAGAVGRQSALHKENNGFAAPTLGRHISTFRGYQILFSIRNAYINRSPIIFQFIHNHLTLRKWCYTRVDGTVCPVEYALYRLPCDLYVVYVCK